MKNKNKSYDVSVTLQEMPKGNKTITIGYTTFHGCPCGYDIEDVSSKLIEMKKRLHRKKCQQWKEEGIKEISGIFDLPLDTNPNQINRASNIIRIQKNREMIIERATK